VVCSSETSGSELHGVKIQKPIVFTENNFVRIEELYNRPRSFFFFQFTVYPTEQTGVEATLEVSVSNLGKDTPADARIVPRFRHERILPIILDNHSLFK
jgi:hypothetical protein